MQVRCALVYNDYFIYQREYPSVKSLKTAKTRVLKEMKRKLEEDLNHQFATKRRYYVKIPLSDVHCGHPVGQSSTMGHYVDKRIANKIYELVKHNISKVMEVKRFLDQYLEEDLFGGVSNAKKPKKSNRRYYLTKKDFSNHIAKAISSFKCSTDDQESLKIKVLQWKEASPDSKFFFRPRDDISKDDGSSSVEASFLFMHQEPWQQ